MPLQRLTMSSDYSQRPINPLPLPSKGQPPRAILIASSRPTTPANSMPIFFNSGLLHSARNPHPFQPITIGNKFQRRLESYGYYDDAPKFNFKTRKFEDFSAGEEITMERAAAPTLCSQYRQAILESPNNHVASPDFLLSAQPITQSFGQPTIPNPEDHSRPLNFQNHAALSTSSQQPANSGSNASVSNWRQALVSSCVVGVALVAVATGYACTTVFRGALNVGQFIYTNREITQQTFLACTQAVQSTYNAAKRRMVSIPVPRLPVGMRRRYAPPPTLQSRSRQRRSFWQSRFPARSPAQSLQPINPAVSILAEEGIPGVEFSGLSDVGKIPDRQDAPDPDAFVLPYSSDALASGAPYMTGALFHEPTPPPPSPSPMQEVPVSKNLSGTPTPDDMELTEHPCISYEESVFSEDIEDEYLAEDNKANQVTVAQFFGDEGPMELEEDLWSLPGQFETQSLRKASTSLDDPNQTGPTSASPISETASHISEATALVIEHVSPIIVETGSPATDPGSPHPSPPGSFSPPPSPIPQDRLTPSPPPLKTPNRQAGKSRKRKAAPGAKAAEMPKSKTPLAPRKRSPAKPTRKSNRIAEFKDRERVELRGGESVKGKKKGMIERAREMAAT